MLRARDVEVCADIACSYRKLKTVCRNIHVGGTDVLYIYVDALGAAQHTSLCHPFIGQDECLSKSLNRRRSRNRVDKEADQRSIIDPCMCRVAAEMLAVHFMTCAVFACRFCYASGALARLH